MCFLGLIKRIAPFFAALTLGLFIAGLFGATLRPTFPNFDREGRRGWRERHLRADEELRRENERLRRELEFQKSVPSHIETLDVPPVVTDVPPPPPAPRAVRPAHAR